MMDRPDLLRISRIALIGLALGCIPACKDEAATADPGQNTAAAAPAAAKSGHAPNPSTQAPPSKAFAQFERLDTPKFYSTQQFTVFNPRGMPGSVDSIQYNYVYADGRFAKVHAYDTDATLQIFKFGSAEQAKAQFDRAVAGTVPLADAGKVKLPKCAGEKSDGDDFIGPAKLVKRLPNPRGGEIVVTRSGDFNMYDCTRGSNRSESAVWTEGEYFFSASALPISAKRDDVADGRAEELAADYVAALGPH